MAGKNVLSVIINADDKTKAAFQSATQNAGRFAAGMTAAFAGATLVASNFERGLAEIQTLLGEGAAPAVAKMRLELLALSKQSGQTLGALTKARYDIISAGFTDAADSGDVLNASLLIARGGLVDAATAADLMTTAINGMGLEADQAERVADVLFTTVRLGKTTMTELAGSMGQVFSTARVARVSLEEVGAAMATITAAGIDTREASTALNNLLRALAAPSKEAAKELAKLGISLDDGLGPALAALGRAGGEGLDKLAELVPNIRALKAAAAAGSDIETFNDNLAQMADNAGDAREAANIMARTLSERLKELRSSALVLAEGIGQELLPAIKGLVDAMSTGLDFFSGMPKEFKTIGVAAGVAVTGVAALAAAFGSLAFNLGNAAKGLAVLKASGVFQAALAGVGAVGAAAAAGAAVALPLIGTTLAISEAQRRKTYTAGPVPQIGGETRGGAPADFLLTVEARDARRRSAAEASAFLIEYGDSLDVAAVKSAEVTEQVDLIAQAMQLAAERSAEFEGSFQAAIGDAPSDLEILRDALIELGAPGGAIGQVQAAIEGAGAPTRQVSKAYRDMAEAVEEVAINAELLAVEVVPRMIEGWSMMEGVLAELRIIFGQFRDDIRDFAVDESITAVGDAAASAIVDGQKFGVAFASAFDMIKKAIISAIVQFIVFQVVLKSLLSLLPGGGLIQGFLGLGNATGSASVPRPRTAATGFANIPGSPGLDRTPILARGGEMLLSPERANQMRSAMFMPQQGRPSLLKRFAEGGGAGEGVAVSIRDSALIRAEAVHVDDVLSEAESRVGGLR